MSPAAAMRILVASPRSHRSPSRTSRRGFTLMEMMISVTILGVISAAAVGFLRVQLRAVTKTAGRFDAQQNATFSSNLVEQELRVAGVGVRDAQPLIVHAAREAIAFNGDIVTNLAPVPGLIPPAVYYDPDAPANAVNVLTTARQITLPGTAWRYPGANYVGSSAETISYYFVADTFSDLANERMLMRRVNDQPARMVARGIRYNASIPFFRYFRRTTTGLAEITIPTAGIWHSDPIHKPKCRTSCTTSSNENSQSSALTDSIAVVQVAFTGLYRDARGDSATRTIVRRIAIKNAGLLGRPTCGDAPAAPSSLNLRALTSGEPDYPGAMFRFRYSGDETSGDNDVKAYAIYRRISPAVDWGDPITIIPASSPPGNDYEFPQSLEPGTVVKYAVAAQDCGLTYSARPETGTLLIP
jgi:prepilin-type N-terminal cleavage/methylation domain-containing protein